MLLVIDVGNTNTVLGLYEGEELLHDWRIRTVIDQVCQKYFGIEPLIVGPGVKTVMPIFYDNPREGGADRIVNAVAAYEKYHRSLIIVDFGTATTFDYVNSRGD